LKYRSHNSVRSIAVAQDDGSTLMVEGVDKGMWDAVAEGRSRLKKLAWSAVGELDGKEVRVVPKGVRDVSGAVSGLMAGFGETRVEHED